MSALSFDEYKRRWDAAGWCLIENVIPPDLLARAQAALPALFPTADEFADQVDPDRNAPFMTERDAPRPQFPFEAASVEPGRAPRHDHRHRRTDARGEGHPPLSGGGYGEVCERRARLRTAASRRLREPPPLVVPRTDAGYQHVTMFIYLSDVTPETDATPIVSHRTHGRHPRGAHVSSTWRNTPACTRWRNRCQDRPVLCSSTARTCSTAASPSPHLVRARFLLPVAFKPAATDWIGYHAFPTRGEDMAWHRFMRHATERQLTVLGFPEPGDPYWNAATLAGVAARYPSLDMTPWRDA